MKKQNGFTLIELMIVVAIIGFLSMIALPSYRDYVIRGQLTEATTTLSSLRVSLEQYYQDNTHYGSNALTCGVPMPAGKYFVYTCNSGGLGNQFYTVTATGIATESTNGFTFTIKQDNTRETTAVPSADWGTATISCWVAKKGGEC